MNQIPRNCFLGRHISIVMSERKQGQLISYWNKRRQSDYKNIHFQNIINKRQGAKRTDKERIQNSTKRCWPRARALKRDWQTVIHWQMLKRDSFSKLLLLFYPTSAITSINSVPAMFPVLWASNNNDKTFKLDG